MPHQTTDSKEVILDAAEHLIQQRGYHGLSMRALALESGLAKGTIYHHFRDKRDVCLRVIERDIVTVRARFTEAAKRGTTCEERLRSVIEEYFLRARERRNVILAALRELANEDPEARALIRRHSEQFIKPAASLIEQGIAEGRFRSVDVEMTVVSVLGIMNGFITYRLLLDDAPSGRLGEAVVDHTFELLMEGIRRHG